MPGPRFLGWREWASVTPVAPDEPFRSAIWSDDDRLGESDGFNLAGWRAECNAGLRGAIHGRHDGPAAVAKPSHPSKPSRPAKLAKPGALPSLPGIMGIPHGPEVTPERLVYGGVLGRRSPAPTRLPPLKDVADANLPSPREPPNKDLENLSHVMLAFDAQTFSVCRGDVLSAMAERDQQQAELAHHRRTTLHEAGKEHRRLAALWRHRTNAGSRRADSELDSIQPTSQDPEQQLQDRNTLRVMRQQRNIQRIFGQERGQGQESPEGATPDFKSDGPRKSLNRRASEAVAAESAVKARTSLVALRDRVLAHLAKAKVRVRRNQSQLSLLRKERFAQLPEAEQRLCQEAFECHKQKGENATTENLLRCLCEMGLGGLTSSERFAVQVAVQTVLERLSAELQQGERTLTTSEPLPLPAPCSPVGRVATDSMSFARKLPGFPSQRTLSVGETSTGSQKVRFSDAAAGDNARALSVRMRVEDFAVELVPAVRGALSLERTDRHFQLFMDAMPDKNAVSITTAQFLSVCGDLPLDMQHVESLLAAVAPKEHHHSASPRNRRKADGGKGHQARLDFEAVHEVLLQLEERTDRARRQQERQLRADTGLSAHLFWLFRDELLRLHEQFCEHAKDAADKLSHCDVTQILCHLGLRPREPDTLPVLNQMLQDLDSQPDGGITFEAFLKIMHAMRHHQQKLRERRLRQEFWKFDTDRDGKVDIKEMIQGLVRKGICKTVVDSTFKEILREFDDELNGGLTFEHFQELCQHAVEQIFSSLNERHLRLASSMGFDESTMQELRFMFEQLDIDNSESLSLFEVQLALQSFVVDPANMRTFDEHFRTLDSDHDGELNFDQFMDLIRLLTGGRVVIAQEPHFTVRSGLSTDQKRDLLRLFPLSESYVRELGEAELLETVCCLTHLEPDDDLRELPEPVNDIDELVEYAKTQATKYSEARQSSSGKQSPSGR